MSKFSILYWDNTASMNIFEHCSELGLDDICIKLEKEAMFLDEPDSKADVFIAASSHYSSTGKPALVTHPTGNWGKAELGGEERTLSMSYPAGQKKGLQFFAQNPVEIFEVTMEVSHHGPTNWEKPLFFIEIGSSEREWKIKEAGELVASAISEIIDDSDEYDSAVAFGGTHYCPSFNRIQIENPNIAIGHIAPRYASEFLDEKIVLEAVKKSSAELAIIDWKGLKSEARGKVISALAEAGIEWKKSSEL